MPPKSLLNTVIDLANQAANVPGWTTARTSTETERGLQSTEQSNTNTNTNLSDQFKQALQRSSLDNLIRGISTETSSIPRLSREAARLLWRQKQRLQKQDHKGYDNNELDREFFHKWMVCEHETFNKEDVEEWCVERRGVGFDDDGDGVEGSDSLEEAQSGGEDGFQKEFVFGKGFIEEDEEDENIREATEDLARDVEPETDDLDGDEWYKGFDRQAEKAEVTKEEEEWLEEQKNFNALYNPRVVYKWFDELGKSLKLPSGSR
ncbi:hypothetical protein BDV18DRAFT_159109 [Aspergillus unguis]